MKAIDEFVFYITVQPLSFDLDFSWSWTQQQNKSSA